MLVDAFGALIMCSLYYKAGREKNVGVGVAWGVLGAAVYLLTSLGLQAILGSVLGEALQTRAASGRIALWSLLILVVVPRALGITVSIAVWINMVRPLSEAEQAESENTLDAQLLKAASEGRLGSVKHLLEEGADLEARGDTGATPLLVSASKGHTEVVDWLLVRGADRAACDDHGRTASALAEQGDRREVLELLDS